MYKLTYNNGYVRYSIHPYGRFNAKKLPSDIIKSEKVIEDNNEDCPSEHWLFSGD